MSNFYMAFIWLFVFYKKFIILNDFQKYHILYILTVLNQNKIKNYM